jgi:DNA-binding PadR family transcriptional regulator
MGLPVAALQILITLADADRHGYAIMQDVADRTDGAVRLGPGTLYGTIKRLLQDGLIQELDARSHPADDERRRYYRITSRGRRAAAEEIRTLATLVRQARATGLVVKPS